MLILSLAFIAAIFYSWMVWKNKIKIKLKNILLVSLLIISAFTEGCVREKAEQPQKWEWNKPLQKNLEIEELYTRSTNLPNNHTLCIPVNKFVCNLDNCQKIKPTVFNLIGQDKDQPIFSRCDSKGCNTYEVTMDSSGEYKNTQSVEPKGFLFKMSYNTIDKKFVEVATLGLSTYISYGYCLYSFEYKKQ